LNEDVEGRIICLRRDESNKDVERNDEGRSKEGDAVELNIPPTRSEQEVAHLWQGLILVVPNFVVLGICFSRKCLAGISTFKRHKVGRI
jgi:hypothetical protein